MPVPPRVGVGVRERVRPRDGQVRVWHGLSVEPAQRFLRCVARAWCPARLWRRSRCEHDRLPRPPGCLYYIAAFLHEVLSFIPYRRHLMAFVATGVAVSQPRGRRVQRRAVPGQTRNTHARRPCVARLPPRSSPCGWDTSWSSFLATCASCACPHVRPGLWPPRSYSEPRRAQHD